MRRLLTVWLLFALPLAGITVCASGAAACPMMQKQAGQDCCHERIGRSLQGCCGTAGAEAPAALRAVPSAQVYAPAVQLAVAPFACIAPVVVPISRYQLHAVTGGLAPPDTPVQQQVSLLI